MNSVILAIVFGGTIILGVPIAFSMGITALVGLALLKAPMQLAILKYFGGLDVFVSYIAYVSGTDTHAGRVVTAGVSWPFEWRARH